MQSHNHPDDVGRGIRFLHAVGTSTLRQGLTVPVSVQSAWARQLNKGQTVPVTICFADGLAVEATLRRINNAVGHLQFRYEAKKHTPLARLPAPGIHKRGGRDKWPSRSR